MLALKKVVGNGMAAALDLSMGIFIVFLASKVAGREIAVSALVIGAILAVLPDFDVIFMFLGRGKVYGDHHQMWPHRPAIVIPVVVLLGWFLGGVFWGIVGGACVFWHYIHDTRGFGGGGIAWFWPLSKKYYSLKGAEDPKDSLMAQSEGNHESYIEKEVLGPSTRFLIEYALSAVIIGAVAVGLFGLLIGSVVGIAMMLSAITACLLSKKITTS
ncbi:MAG: hypothetical protein G01um10143_306 [Parcubacteria group bacterium Gr01-1014_3]|nr:MAG: hypothetical protein G01um10143_306 [Parcubacteria group bacterium Gr01-1014_3]